MKRYSSLFAALTIAAAPICQQDPPVPVDKTVVERTAASKAPFVFEAGDVELVTLIERCGAYLQRNILCSEVEMQAAPNAARGRAPRAAPPPKADGDTVTGPMVSLQLPVITDRDGCEELLTSLLWSFGLALVPLDEQKGVYEVLSMNGPRGREIAMAAAQRTPEQVLARPSLRQFVTVVYPLQHTNATIATNALRPFFAASGSQGAANLIMGNVGNSTAIILTGPQHMVAGALVVLQAADVPPPPEVRPDIEVRFEAQAKQIEALLQRLAALEQKLGKQGG